MSYVSEAIKAKFLNIQNEMVNKILNKAIGSMNSI